MRSRLAFPRFVIKPTIILLLLLAVVVSLIHSQPFDDQGLDTLLFADDCPSTCFVGIQAGMTTAAQARDLLEKRGFVAQWIEPLQPLDPQTDSAGVGTLKWRWSSNRPELLTGTDASLTYDLKSGLVMNFGEMGTRLTLGNWFILLGQPSMGFMSGGYNDRDGSIFTHAAGYPQRGLNLISTIQCPMSLRQLWDAPVTLQLAPTAEQSARFTQYPSSIQMILGFAASGFC
ncbi:MAG: hypothetical protein ABI970_10905 [Chloroflexota bacterium]